MLNRIKWIIEGRSGRWPKFRKEFLKKNFCCESCCTLKNLEVHHIIPFKVNKELELKEHNCLTLCKYCHLVLAHFKDYRLYNPNVVDDVYKYVIGRMRALSDQRKESE